MPLLKAGGCRDGLRGAVDDAGLGQRPRRVAGLQQRGLCVGQRDVRLAARGQRLIGGAAAYRRGYGKYCREEYTYASRHKWNLTNL
jgi:hypothetical protein